MLEPRDEGLAHGAVHPGLWHDRTLPDRDLLPWSEHIGDGRARAGTAPPAGPFGCEVQIVDADDKALPPGTVGEIVVAATM